MRQRTVLLAAAISTGVLTMPTFAQQDPDSNKLGNAAHNAADEVRDAAKSTRGALTPATQPGTFDSALAPDANNIRIALADTTDAGVTKDGFKKLVRQFVDADRDRINKNNLNDADWAKLDGRIDQIRKDWKAKYNQDFAINDKQMVFNDQFRIVQGEIGQAVPAAARMGEKDANANRIDKGISDTGVATGDTVRRDPGLPNTTPDRNADQVAGGDTNREPGRKVAKVTFPDSHGLGASYIPLIHEFPNSWKIDVPDQVDGQKLYDNLLNHLTMVGESRDQWPADVNDAYRLVSHHVMMAVMDQESTQHGM